MNNNIEEFFLRGIVAKKNISVKKSLEGTIRGFLLATVLIWIGFHFLAHVVDNELNVFLLNVLYFPLIPLAILLSKKTIDSGLKDYMNNREQKKYAPAIKAVSMISGILGIGIARFLFSRLTIEASEIFFSIIVALILLIMTSCVSLGIYKIKLIKKYSPHLLDKIV